MNIPLWIELGTGLQPFTGDPATPCFLPKKQRPERTRSISAAFTTLTWELVGDTAV